MRKVKAKKKAVSIPNWKEEYKKKGIRFGFGIPRRSSPGASTAKIQEDYRISDLRQHLEDFRRLKEDKEKPYKNKRKLSESIKESLDDLSRREKQYSDLLKNSVRLFRVFDFRAATRALKYYNRKHFSKFELVECLGGSAGMVCGEFRCHTNFRARNIYGGQEYLFFAELLGVEPEDDEVDKRRVSRCEILDVCECGFVRGCDMCRGEFGHPSAMPEEVKEGLKLVKDPSANGYPENSSMDLLKDSLKSATCSALTRYNDLHRVQLELVGYLGYTTGLYCGKRCYYVKLLVRQILNTIMVCRNFGRYGFTVLLVELLGSEAGVAGEDHISRSMILGCPRGEECSEEFELTKKQYSAVTDTDERFMKFEFRAARCALLRYNLIHRTKFEVVECLRYTTGFILGKNYCHIKFFAQEFGAPVPDVKLFFAELIGVEPEDGEVEMDNVSHCLLLIDPEEYGSVCGSRMWPEEFGLEANLPK